MSAESDSATPPRRRPLPLRRRIQFAVVVGVVAAVAVIAIAEIAFRLQYDSSTQITGVAEWQPGRFGEQVYSWDAYHPELGWTNLANYRSSPAADYEVTINGQGLRADREYQPRAAAGVRRLALFGDSCTFGEEVDDDGTVPRFLARHLEAVEALNFGVHGYGYGQMVRRLELEGAAFAPDHVVLVVMLPEDLVRDSDPMFLHPKPVFRMQDHALVVDNVPVPVAHRLPWIVRTSYVAAWLASRPAIRGADAADAVAVTAALTERARSACEAHGAELTIVLIASPGRLQLAMRDPAAQAGLDQLRREMGRLVGPGVLDLTRPLLRLLAELRDRAVAGNHWSARVNCELAGWIAEHLVEQAGLQFAANRPRCQRLR